MDITNFFVHMDKTVNDAVKQIDLTAKKIVFIVDDNKRLVGVFTDGDMRRHILNKGKLTDCVTEAMNRDPICFTLENEWQIDDFWKENRLVAIPVVDHDRKVVKARFWNDEVISEKLYTIPNDVPVVIMAGGKGTRLYPYTKILPKPLIPIGDLPITEHIIKRFQLYGLHKFFLVINHKKAMIKAYFNEVEKNYDLSFIEEEKFLGTGGGLSLLKGKISGTFFLSNCDILIDSDYECMYRHHKQYDNKITIITAIKNMVVPYGVIEVNETGDIKKMVEKPEFSFMTNTGVYIIEPEVLDFIDEDKPIDLPEIAKYLLSKGEKVGIYPITEKSWLDMGQLEEMENMLKTLQVY